LLKGPDTPNFKKPVVGDPPRIQASCAEVGKPNPNNLSKNAHKNIKPIINRTETQKYTSAIYTILKN
jgi:hypothetical protein